MITNYISYKKLNQIVSRETYKKILWGSNITEVTPDPHSIMML